MKKHKIILLILLIAILICSFFVTVYKNRQIFFNQFWTLIERQLTHEQFLDIGHEFIYASWPDLNDEPYILTQYESVRKLEYVKNGERTTLLDSVITQMFIKEKGYVIAKDGYAVLDRYNVATIYTSEDRVSIENVHYITCFEDFEKEDREVFESLGYPDKLSKLLVALAIITCLFIAVITALIVITTKKHC